MISPEALDFTSTVNTGSMAPDADAETTILRRSTGTASYAIGACNDDCGGANSQYLHERVVYRWGNVVVILYIWGREDQSNPDTLATYAATINGRVR